jgi:hypothetical protein
MSVPGSIHTLTVILRSRALARRLIVILRSRALARRLEGSPPALVAHPSRLAEEGEHLSR